MINFDKGAAGRVIRRLRKQKKLTQEVLSGLAVMARSHLAMIESGAKEPNFETLWRIAYALNVTPHELVQFIEVECSES